MKHFASVLALLAFVSQMAVAQVATVENLSGKWKVDMERTISFQSGEFKEMLSNKTSPEYKIMASHWLEFIEDGNLRWEADGMPGMKGTWKLENSQLHIALTTPDGHKHDLSYMAAVGGGNLGITKINGPENFLPVTWFKQVEE